MIRGSTLRTVRLGVKNLMLHPLRSFLTTLGITIGVAAVICMLAVGEGASYEAQQKIKALGSNNILLRSVKPAELETQQQSSMAPQRYGLEYEEVEILRETMPAVRVVVPVRELNKSAAYGEFQVNVPVYGTTEQWMSVSGVKLYEGRFLVEADSRYSLNVCVLGTHTAGELFPFENPIGSDILIAKKSFRVVGIYGPRDDSESGALAADGIVIPIESAREYFGELEIRTSAGSREFKMVQLQEIKVQIEGEGNQLEDNVVATAASIRQLLTLLHDQPDYVIDVPLEKLQAAKEQAQIWQIFLGVIASMALVVAGIGIMNVMLATVTERTREIGIRRALGAKRGHIISQFLVETVVLSCAGGLLGVALGIAAPMIVEAASGMKAIFVPSFAVLAFTISAGVGVLFGIYPAWRAAQMDPVEALRHE
ncbi:MAG: ABC transporter permease [Planctomycetes bacterium]|nr:ABC transporter permease [Planctomycetota bacterium]MCB9890457.1 ABC transporter permease [Planctomycetota bacterium]MCB9917698.1 ABC transporter permease [Planctomycetota bacterium]